MNDINKIAHAILGADLTSALPAIERRQLFVRLESDLQALCIDVATASPLSNRIARVYSVPNEGKMSYVRGVAMRASGRTSGVCDLQVDLIGGDSFRAEIKMPGNYASDAQRAFINSCNATRHRAYLVYTLVEWCRVLVGEISGTWDTYYMDPHREITKAGRLRGADPYPGDVR